MHRLALLVSLAATACVADGGDEGFSIVHNLSPGTSCATSPGGTFVARGTLDVRSPNPYILTPEIESRIVASQDQIAQRTIALRGARVEVINTETGASIDKFTSLFSASLSPGGSTSVAFDIIQPEILPTLGVSGNTRVQLLAKVTAFGALGGSGDTIDSVTFQYPVTVCDGCVVQIVGACPLAFGTEVIDMANSCNAFQDGFVQCCDSGGVAICPAMVSTMPPAAQ